MRPPLRYAKTVDGGNVAYVEVGQGYPLITFHIVRGGNLGLEWDVPLLVSWHQAFARHFRYIRFEPRGVSNSDPAPETCSNVDYILNDIDAVAAAVGIDKFALMTHGQFAEIGLHYAATRPEAVTHLAILDPVTRDVPEWTNPDQVKYGRASREIRAASQGLDVDTYEAAARLGRSATEASIEAFIRCVRTNETPKWDAMWPKVLEMWARIDVAPFLPLIEAETLVLSQATLYDPMARDLATAVPGWSLALGVFSLTHYMESEANARPTPVTELVRLIYGDGAATAASAKPKLEQLTTRELEILALIAAGHSNQEIGESLVLSASTVSRHVANVYAKLGIHNRAQATAAYFGVANEGSK